MVRPSVLRVKSRLLSPLSGWSHVLLINRRSMAPVYRNFVKCTAPRGLRAVKSVLNPGYCRVKPPLCFGARGAGVSFDWCIKARRGLRFHLHRGEIWSSFKREQLRLKWVGNTTTQLTPSKLQVGWGLFGVHSMPKNHPKRNCCLYSCLSGHSTKLIKSVPTKMQLGTLRSGTRRL